MMNVAIVDDHKLLTDAIEMALKSIFPESRFEVFNQPAAFLEKLKRKAPVDILITDLLMPQMSGIDLIVAAREIAGDTIKIIVLTSVNDSQTIRHALRSGANAYISKDGSLNELPLAIREVNAGGEFISPALEKMLIKSMFTEDQYVFHLSPREKQVLSLLCSGFTIKEMAHNMGLSAHTVQTYQKKIMKKFRVNRTADLIVFAIQNGLYHVVPK
jgi:DNA-binding NarL/FixJ family response regulator